MTPQQYNECFRYVLDRAYGYLTLLQRLWHKGTIRKSEYGYYDKVISTLKKRYLRRKF